MPVKLRKHKQRAHRITPDAIEAYRAHDYHALHDALGLKPWEPSPLPLHVTPLGCDQEPYPFDLRLKGSLHNESWEQAQELQRELEKAV
ncbi:hypothetical protein AUC71_02390 [Methyloceanibacter marginalis]|uniref:Uncharacterized protein n=1 Tax=Methyloceanibacter marginalis TaxID=1774971 RepID=A0A1E3W8H5_9HYPH|nr:hypothetical protein AUC71_02390 [Methyloceanibacter marginalis]